MTEGVKSGHKRRTLERAFEQLYGICTKDFGGHASWELLPRFAKPSDTEPPGENGEALTEPDPSNDARASENVLSEPCEEARS